MARRLLLDMDGPLAGFDERCSELAKAFEFTVAETHARYFTDQIHDQWEKDAMNSLIEAPGWFYNLPVTDGAIEGVNLLLDAGVDVWIATKPMEKNPTCRDDKAKWVRRHFPMLEKKLFIAPDKSLLRGDILLDDAPKISWMPKAEWNPVIFTRPFNGAGSLWEDFPHWSWGDDLDDLFG